MSDYHNSLRRDPIQRDPIYDALDAWNREELPVATYGSGLFWGSIVGFLVVAGILLIAYEGSYMRTVGSSNLRTAQTEITQPRAVRIITLPAPSSRAISSSQTTLALNPAGNLPQIVSLAASPER